MLEYLDIRTLALINLLFFFLYGLFTLSYAFYNKQFQGLETLGWAFIVGGAGFFLLGLRQIIPDVVSIIIANTLLYVCFFMIFLGLMRFNAIEFKIGNIFGLFIGAVVFVLFVYFTVFEPSVKSRILTISAALAIQSAMIIVGLGYARLVVKSNIATIILIGFYLLFMVFMVFRIIHTASNEEVNNFMKAGTVHAVATILFQVLTLVTSFIVLWLASNKLNYELEMQVRRDPLTGLYNLRAFEELAEMEMSRSIRYNKEFSIISFDLDYFRSINDLYGHSFGDTQLVQIAKIITRHIRDHDIAARADSDEFHILLFETSIQQAAKIAEKLRLEISETGYQHGPITDIHVFASFGVATYLQGQKEFAQLLDLSKEALTQAKDSGRNCVIVSKKGLAQFMTSAD
jgi:diguanylate cyclase (GGDEF)-like protein